MFATTRILVLLGGMAVAAYPLEAQRRDNNVITAEEIFRADPKLNTAYDAVQPLRPRWLKRGGERPQASQLRVYLNDHDVGEADYLKTIPADRVAELHWFSANEAGVVMARARAR